MLQAGVIPGYADVFKDLSGGVLLFRDQVLVMDFHEFNTDLPVVIKHVHEIFIMRGCGSQAGCVTVLSPEI